MISRSSPPAVGTIQMCGVFVLASRLTSTTVKITHLPSGETTGSPTCLSFIMSSKVKGCFACAKAEMVKATRARRTGIKRRIREPPQQTEKCSRVCVATPSLRTQPGVHQAHAATFEIGGVAGGQNGAARAGNSGDLCVEFGDGSAFRAAAGGYFRERSRGVFV